jgi:cytochrome c-type biogenesis protein CcmE
MKNRYLPIVPLVIAFAIIGYLSVSSTSYKSVSELGAIDKPTRVAVMGNVSKCSVFFKDNHLEFVITDGKNSVKVVYHKYMNLDNVSGYGIVVVEGIYYPDNNTIFANSVQSKCPSKEVLEYREKMLNAS